MKLQLSEEIFGIRQWTCQVKSNKNVATYIKELILELPENEQVPFQAGGYIQIEAPPHKVDFKDFDINKKYYEEWKENNLFQYKSIVNKPVSRAYSMASYPEEKGIIKLNIRIAFPPRNSTNIPPGKMSSYVFSLKKGDEVVISGPYGEFFATDNDTEMIYIGGGAGMAPMRSHIFDLFKRVHTKRKVSFWYGARSKREIFYKEDFNKIAEKNKKFTWHVALSDPQKKDNWKGDVGFIHEVLYNNYLKYHEAPEDCEYYICGPPMMNDACFNLLDSLGVEQDNIFYDDFGI